MVTSVAHKHRRTQEILVLAGLTLVLASLVAGSAVAKPGNGKAAGKGRHATTTTVLGSGSGANTGPGPYAPSGVGLPSGNGNSGGAATGKPCAGCVGNADAKNPPGQRPGPHDHNNGYECDGNSGIARTNPAHSGCTTTTGVPPSTTTSTAPPTTTTTLATTTTAPPSTTTTSTPSSTTTTTTPSSTSTTATSTPPSTTTTLLSVLGNRLVNSDPQPAPRVSAAPTVRLPSTGVDLALQVTAGLGVLLTGLGLVLAARRGPVTGVSRTAGND